MRDSVDHVVHSIASDLVAGVTNGKIMAAKQFLLALGFHKITGTRKVVDIVSRLGHYINYKTTCEIETAQVVKAQSLSERSSALPLVPIEQPSFVLTVFWVDNFDVKVQSQIGKNSINITHLVAYQEKSEASKLRDNNFSYQNHLK